MDPVKLIERFASRIPETNANVLEKVVRLTLVNLSWHLSNKSIFEWVSTDERKLSVVTPTRFVGNGRLRIGKGVVFGVVESPRSFSETRIDARNPKSTIEIGDNVAINNSSLIASVGSSIKIGSRCLIGPEFMCYDNNGHMLSISQRLLDDDTPLPVQIGDDVFIGARVVILKGASIGSGCVIAAGSVIFPRFSAPPMSIIAGNPATIVGKVP